MAWQPCQSSRGLEQSLTRLCALEETLARTSAQVQAFGEMVRQRQADRLVQWLAEIKAQGVPELRSFAKALHKDSQAVKAGVTLEWSHGPTEGQVHTLKVLKRLMYGQASFALLRQRGLSSA